MLKCSVLSVVLPLFASKLACVNEAAHRDFSAAFGEDVEQQAYKQVEQTAMQGCKQHVCVGAQYMTK